MGPDGCSPIHGSTDRQSSEKSGEFLKIAQGEGKATTIYDLLRVDELCGIMGYMTSQTPSSPSDQSPREEIGLAALQPFSESPSPIPVDRDQIRALLEGRLPVPEFRRVLRLIHTYREWHDAQREVILEQYETWRKLKDALGQSLGEEDTSSNNSPK